MGVITSTSSSLISSLLLSSSPTSLMLTPPPLSSSSLLPSSSSSSSSSAFSEDSHPPDSQSHRVTPACSGVSLWNALFSSTESYTTSTTADMMINSSSSAISSANIGGNNIGISGNNSSSSSSGGGFQEWIFNETTKGGGLGSLCLCTQTTISERSDELTIEDVKYLTYGILWPTICALGIIGNVLNLIVLNQPNMKGTAYIYMRGYSSAALMAIIVAIPFAVRVLFHNEVGPWNNVLQAFFHTYLELYLGNSCLGIGVMMLVALTMERFVAVCHPEKSRALQGSHKAYIIISSIPLLTLLAHSPHLFRNILVQCVSTSGRINYQGKENETFVKSIVYLMYRWFIGIVFRLGPTVLLAYLNLRIIIAYRRTCAKRRIMTGKTSRDESKKIAEESRIMLLLGSTSVLFFVCVTPMVILSLLFSMSQLKSFSFQVFRSTANLLEVTNYSLTFYIYFLFSREFRNTFLGLVQRAKGGITGSGAGTNNKPSGGTGGKRENTPTPTPPVDQLLTGTTPLL